MRPVLVIGGAGTFGGRLVRLLAQAGNCRIIIGGRDLLSLGDFSDLLGSFRLFTEIRHFS